MGLADVAAGQWGMFTTAQARAGGVSAQGVARLCRDGRVERVRHGVYRLAGVPLHMLDQVRAAWLALAPGREVGQRLAGDPVGVLSHRSAAQLHRLGDLDADLHEFTVCSRKQTRDPDVRFHRGSLARARWTVVEGLPVTTVAATLADLAAARTDGGHLATVVRDAVAGYQLTLPATAAALAPHAAVYGARPGDGAALAARMIAEAGVPQNALDLARIAADAYRHQAAS